MTHALNPLTNHSPVVTPIALAAAALLACSASLAQTQMVKSPVAQYWMDVATISMAGMDDMPDMGALGGLMGGMTGMPGMGGVSFGATRGMMPGRWLDLAVSTQRKPAGTEAVQTIPPSQAMGPSLTLLPVKAQAQKPSQRGGSVDEVPEPPKGRILFYWGCSDTVRSGQPRILDFAKMGFDEYGKFMMGRATHDTGAKAIPGHAVWPNETHRQKVPPEASLTGPHALSGDGLPASLQFSIGQQQDFMPKLALVSQGGGAAASHITWQRLPTAQAYFLNAMSGSDNAGATEMVIWSSSEVPEPGWGLMDYANNASVDKWLKEKVLLPASKTDCAVPAGIFAKAEGAMLRGIAYGQELNLAHPPRPADKRIAWEPEWTAKVRVKALSMVMLGEEGDNAGSSKPARSRTGESTPEESGSQPPIGIPGLPDVGKALKGLFGR
ncbi:MAG: hypothetical protein PHQ58_00475 [Rhodoferax sp.]|uniref:hypothetical protein n=1 Tax=Rhodoferax sp. TaxID=50421 RepID=UPI0026235ECD|nr:hypothetical protein [Rhodoferax sp.]MDD2878885.1 hypothetical protein [Rhodoferax sp.]